MKLFFGKAKNSYDTIQSENIKITASLSSKALVPVVRCLFDNTKTNVIKLRYFGMRNRDGAWNVRLNRVAPLPEVNPQEIGKVHVSSPLIIMNPHRE